MDKYIEFMGGPRDGEIELYTGQSPGYHTPVANSFMPKFNQEYTQLETATNEYRTKKQGFIALIEPERIQLKSKKAWMLAHDVCYISKRYFYKGRYKSNG